MIEIRWHGRGGQGVVTAANILGAAAMRDGKYAQSFPFFGAERRGAPVSAFTRIDSQAIRLRSQIYNPHWVVILDDSLLELVKPLDGLRDGGGVVINTKRDRDSLPRVPLLKAFDASAIAQETIGRPVVNTVMLGALAAVGLVSLPSLAAAIEEAFPGAIGQRNVAGARAAFEIVGAAKEVGLG